LKYTVAMNFRSFLVILSFMYASNLLSQSIHIDGDIFIYQNEPRDIEFDRYAIRGGGGLSISYSDTLKGNWDYIIGGGWFSTDESYSSGVEVTSEIDTSRVFTMFVGPNYSNHYFTVSFGMKYWFSEKRKGVYVLAKFIPHVLGSSSLNESFIDNEGQRNFLMISSKDEFEPFNILLQTSVGYRINIDSEFSIQMGFGASMKFGDVVKGLDEGLKINRALNIGASYLF